MQTIQIDKLGTGDFDGTTQVTPGVTAGVAIEQTPAENQILITIDDGIAAGRFDLREIVNIAPTNSLALIAASIGGDFVGNFTGGTVNIIGPDNPPGSGTQQALVLQALTGSDGILIGDPAGVGNIPRWFPLQHLLAITTADTGPYTMILLVEERPTLPLEAAFIAA